MAAICSHCGSADVQAELHVYRCLACEGYTTMDGQPADTEEPLERNPAEEAPLAPDEPATEPELVVEEPVEEVSGGEAEPEGEAG